MNYVQTTTATPNFYAWLRMTMEKLELFNPEIMKTVSVANKMPIFYSIGDKHHIKRKQIEWTVQFLMPLRKPFKFIAFLFIYCLKIACVCEIRAQK